MHNSAQLTTWLDHLRLLNPPRHLVLVGAGNGDGPWVQWMLRAEVAPATLLEADDVQMAALQRRAAGVPGWQTRKQVVASQTTPVTFYAASVTSESGLLEPEQLRDQWPNIKTRQKSTRQAISLAEALHDEQSSVNWLVLDCLPSLPILQGAASQLADIEVLVVRVLLDGNGEVRSDGALEQDGLVRWLSEQGLRHMSTESERHPALGHALFVRSAAERGRQIEQLQLRLTDVQTQAKADASLHADQVAREAAEVRRLRQLHKVAADARAGLEQALSERDQTLREFNARLAQAQTSHEQLEETHKLLTSEMVRIRAQIALMDELSTGRSRQG